MEKAVFMYLLALPINIISLIGSCLIIILFIKAKQFRTYMFKLILIISINDFIRSFILVLPISYFENKIDSTPLCTSIGFIFFFTLIGTNFWILAIAVSLFQILILNKENVEKFFGVWFSAILTYQFSSCVFLLITKSYGFDQNTCVVQDTAATEEYTLIIYFLPIWIEIIVLTGIYIAIYLRYRKINFTMVSEPKFSPIRFMKFPLIMIFCLLPISLDVLLATFHGPYEIVNYIAICVYSSHGFLNCLAFTLSNPIRNYLKEFLMKKSTENEDNFIKTKTYV